MTASLGCAVLLLLPPGLRAESGQPSSPLIGYEVVGQVLNPSAQQSLQYGYLNFVRGIDRITTSTGAAVSESTALFTFFNDTATERVINNGPIRVVDRTGTGAIYFGSGNADFANPDTFRSGTPVQSYTFATSGRDRYLDRLLYDHLRNHDHIRRDVPDRWKSHTGWAIRGSVYRLNVSGKLNDASAAFGVHCRRSGRNKRGSGREQLTPVKARKIVSVLLFRA